MKELDQIILKSYKDRNTINLIYGLSGTYKTSFIRYVASLLNKHVIILDFDNNSWFNDVHAAAVIENQLIPIENKIIMLECYNNLLFEKHPKSFQKLFQKLLNHCLSKNCILFVEHYRIPYKEVGTNRFDTVINMVKENKSWFERLFRLDRITIRFMKNRYHKRIEIKINPKNLFRSLKEMMKLSNEISRPSDLDSLDAVKKYLINTLSST